VRGQDVFNTRKPNSSFGGTLLKRSISCLSLVLLAVSALTAQTTTPSLSYPSTSGQTASAAQKAKKAKKTATIIKPFSRLAFSGGIGVMGINMQAATNVNKYMNVRGVGNYLNYSVNNVSTNGFNIDAKLNFATAGASVDFYPFPTHGFRLSPGALFHNENSASAVVTAAAGTSFTLNDVTYYSSTTNPVQGTGAVGLNTQKTAFTMTTGWGNMIPRKGEHWSFPFEIGAAMVGSPTVNFALTSGQACNAAGANCVNVATDPTVNANVQAQISKYKNDLNQLKVYPIFTFGVSYNFKIR